MRIIDIVTKEDKASVTAFLKRFALEYEDDIDDTIAVYEGNQLIATASTSKNIIKCIAIDSAFQGQNLLGTLMTQLIHRLNERGITHYFVYTIDEQAHLFKALGLKPIVQTMTLALLEGGGDITNILNQLRKDYHVSSQPKAAVVLNANPLTLGHMHLIQTAAKNHDELLVFVVSEERSAFPFKVRFNIVKEACKTLSNVTVLPTGDYLVSHATFPKYFLKQEKNIKEEHAMVDVLIFKQYYMKLFNITKRYVGLEPYSPMTAIYNDTMQKYLGQHLCIIDRKSEDGEVISASIVRRHLKTQPVEHIKKWVPKATYAYLVSEEGRDLIEQLKTHRHRH